MIEEIWNEIQGLDEYFSGSMNLKEVVDKNLCEAHANLQLAKVDHEFTEELRSECLKDVETLMTWVQQIFLENLSDRLGSVEFDFSKKS